MSGEALASAASDETIDAATVERMAKEMARAMEGGVLELAVVVGGGNIWRGTTGESGGMDRATSDTMGMLGTVINALALQDALEQQNQPTRVLSALNMAEVAEPYIRRRALRHLEKGRVVIFAAGLGAPFFTTDTPAALRAAEMGCDALLKGTSVDGVYTADPRIVPDARKLSTISFEEMLEMAASGAGVLQLRSVEYARNHGVRIHCRSSFDDEPGTVVLAEAETMEQPLITAVTHSTSEARVTLVGVPDEPGAAARIFQALAKVNVNVDMIVQNEPTTAGGLAEISFTVPREDLRVSQAALAPLTGEAFADMTTHEEMGKVSIIGAGMRSHPGVAAKVFGVLAGEGVNIDMIATSPIKISCVIAPDRVNTAVQALHSAFGLAGEGTIAEEEPFS